MLNRSYACAALIICTSVAFAQEASTPSDTGGQTSGGGTATMTPAAPANATPIPITTGTSPGVEKKPAAAAGSDQGEGFALPGGLGYAPLNFTPGQGRFDRKPLSFSTTVQQGYDDNINATSGSPLQAPVKGSLVTAASEGVDLLISQARLGLSLGANAGGQYYWDRSGNPLTPTGGLNLVFGYKLTPRAQISAIVNGLYTSQPTLSVVNGLTQSNSKGYLTASSKFDLLYRWAPRFSTDTFYSANGTYQQSSELQGNNNLNQTFGQALRYSFTQLVTGVLEGRFSHIAYSNNASTILNSLQRDSDTFYVLTGADVTLTRRFSGSFRVGDSTRNYQAADQPSTSSPYAESSLNYIVTRSSSLSLDARYGYDDSSIGSSASKSVRVGLSFTQNFSAKLRGTLGANYTHIDGSQSGTLAGSTQDVVDASLGLQYALSKSLAVFGSYNRTQRTSADPLQEYTKNVYYVGATYQY